MIVIPLRNVHSTQRQRLLEIEQIARLDSEFQQMYLSLQLQTNNRLSTPATQLCSHA